MLDPSQGRWPHADAAGGQAMSDAKRQAMAGETALERPSTMPPASLGGAGLPAVIPEQPSPRPPRWHRAVLVAIVIAAGATGALYWATHQGPALPPGIAWSNGRLEADEIDIDTKF